MHVLQSISITNLSCFTYNLAISCFTYTVRNRINVCWDMLKQILWSKSTDFHPVLRYMETEWIKNTTFPVQTWNDYNSTLDNDPRTNNYSEGNNNALNQEVPCTHPSLPRLLCISLL